MDIPTSRRHVLRCDAERNGAVARPTGEHAQRPNIGRPVVWLADSHNGPLSQVWPLQEAALDRCRHMLDGPHRFRVTTHVPKLGQEPRPLAVLLHTGACLSGDRLRHELVVGTLAWKSKRQLRTPGAHRTGDDLGKEGSSLRPRIVGSMLWPVPLVTLSRSLPLPAPSGTFRGWRGAAAIAAAAAAASASSPSGAAPTAICSTDGRAAFGVARGSFVGGGS
mmetsp:Transcript_15340/g.48183  ORF Transcript_15340/g.48183 Transcript_15340/m.48183 type:complete len:221 (-) Transcript_15340:66-728(-)